MNVLEHVEDDGRTLRDFRALLDPLGRAVLVVPQYPWLFRLERLVVPPLGLSLLMVGRKP